MSEQRESSWFPWLVILLLIIFLFIHIKINLSEIRDLQRRVGQLEQQR